VLPSINDSYDRYVTVNLWIGKNKGHNFYINEGYKYSGCCCVGFGSADCWWAEVEIEEQEMLAKMGWCQ